MPSSERRAAAARRALPLQQRIATAGAFTVPGLLVRFTGGAAPYPLQVLAYGAAVVAAAFMLAWATEAAQVDIGHGIVIAVVAFVAILPEYVVEVHYAFTGQAEYVTANLTGASRLLLGLRSRCPPWSGCCADAGAWRRSGRCRSRRRIAWSWRSSRWPASGRSAGWRAAELTTLDAAVLVGLYVLYLRRVAAIGGEGPPPVGRRGADRGSCRRRSASDGWPG